MHLIGDGVEALAGAAAEAATVLRVKSAVQLVLDDAARRQRGIAGPALPGVVMHVTLVLSRINGACQEASAYFVADADTFAEAKRTAEVDACRARFERAYDATLEVRCSYIFVYERNAATQQLKNPLEGLALGTFLAQCCVQ